MPIYENRTNEAVITENGILCRIGEVLELPNYIDDDRLTLIDDGPYYNPNLYTHVISESCEIELKNWDNMEGIEIYNSSTFNMNVYLQSKTNLPSIFVMPKTIRTVYGFHRSVKKLFIEYVGNENSYITELKNREMLETKSI